jgi:hypothetical protein
MCWQFFDEVVVAFFVTVTHWNGEDGQQKVSVPLLNYVL